MVWPHSILIKDDGALHPTDIKSESELRKECNCCKVAFFKAYEAPKGQRLRRRIDSSV